MIGTLNINKISAPGIEQRPSNVFDKDFPKSTNIGKMRSKDEFTILKEGNLKAPIYLGLGYDVKNLCVISLVSYKETQNPDDELTDILKEIAIISYLKHDNVLKYHETVCGKGIYDLAFVFEPYAGLLSEIISEDVDELYEPLVIKAIMRGLFTALEYLHRNRIIHRNISPENIMFSSAGVLKVWNFRNAQKLGMKQGKLKANEFRYQSVELLLESTKCDTSVDIWAANCIFAQLCLKKSIFPESGREKVLETIFMLLGFPTKENWEEFFNFQEAQDLADVFRYFKYNMLDRYFKKNCGRNVSMFAMDLMHRCFQYNPKHRPAAEKCLIHPYFSEEPEACSSEVIKQILGNASKSRQPREVKNGKEI